MPGSSFTKHPVVPLTRRAVLAGALGATAAACVPSGPTTLPSEALPGLAGLTRGGWPVPGIGERQFLGRVSLLNVWATWCPYCQAEHEMLLGLSSDGRFTLVGLVHQDKAERALAYLDRSGNPFAVVAMNGGALAHALGRQALPTTYVVDRQARMRLTLTGALDAERVRAQVVPIVREALGA